MKTDKPEFKLWERTNLDKLCDDLWEDNLLLRDANEQLRLDLKDAMKLLRRKITDEV